MSNVSEVQRLTNAKASLKAAIEGKGVSVPSDATLDTYASKVNQIVTPDATIYVGSGEPSSSLGKDGDIYIKI